MKEQLATYPDLALRHNGAEVVYATDDTYGKKENLNKEHYHVDSHRPLSKNNFDGWLPSFKKADRHWAVIRLGSEAKIVGFQIAICNFPKEDQIEISVDAIHINGRVEDWQLADFLDWDVILKKTTFKASDKHYFQCTNKKPYTHIRLHLHTPGGISRCRVYAEAYKDWNKLKDNEQVDLALITYGGKIIKQSFTEKGSTKNLIAPKKSIHSEDGWFTKGNDGENAFQWVIIKLAHKGFVEKIIVDTYNFFENRAPRCSLEYCIAANDNDVLNNKVTWLNLLPKKGLKPHRENPFSDEDIPDHEAITHVKLKIYPSGGLSRLRLIGSIKK